MTSSDATPQTGWAATSVEASRAEPQSPSKNLRRDPYLDSWRGIFHVVMVVDHLPFVMPGMLGIIAGLFQFLGYVSVAEGFVFLSGYVSGLVYTRVKREKGSRAMWRKAIVRARDIYLCYSIAVLGMVLLLKYGPDTPLDWGSWMELSDNPLGIAILKTGSLLYEPMFLEILPMYSIFLILTPIILGQLEKGRLTMVMACSSLVWITAQFGIRNFLVESMPFGIELHLGVFNSFAWQILFIAGLICGHKTLTVEKTWLPQDFKLVVFAYVLCVCFFCQRHELIAVPFADDLISRSSIGPLRLLNFACVVFLVARSRGFLAKIIAWRGFAFLSRHSLQVFAFHLFPIYLVGLALRSDAKLSVWWQLAIVVFCVLSLFLIGYLAEKFKRLPILFRQADSNGRDLIAPR